MRRQEELDEAEDGLTRLGREGWQVVGIPVIDAGNFTLLLWRQIPTEIEAEVDRLRLETARIDLEAAKRRREAAEAEWQAAQMHILHAQQQGSGNQVRLTAWDWRFPQ